MLFNKTKYTKWYYELITSRRNRQLDSSNYSEKHHIIPKALGGTDEESNLIQLTYREHFIVHWLLTKMCINTFHTKAMYLALSEMRTSKLRKVDEKMCGWKYEKFRYYRQQALLGSKAIHNPITLERKRLLEGEPIPGGWQYGWGMKRIHNPTTGKAKNIRNELPIPDGWLLGNFNSPSVMEKIVAKTRGQERSEETKRRISASKMGELNPFFGRKHPKELQEQINSKLRGPRKKKAAHSSASPSSNHL